MHTTEYYPSSEDNYGFIDKKGDFVIPEKYDDAYSFDNGVARVVKGDKWSLIDPSGNRVTSTKYSAIESFNEGLARVEKDDRFGFINKKIRIRGYTRRIRLYGELRSRIGHRH